MKILVMFVLVVGLGLGSVSTEEPKDLPSSVKTPTKKNTNNESDMDTRRIMRGEYAPEGKFPYAVFVKIDIISCTGSLIKLDWVLFASHCVPPKQSMGPDTFVVGGRANLQPLFKPELAGLRDTTHIVVVQIIRCFIHPAYSSSDLTHDLALGELEKPMISPYIQTISVSFEKMIGPKKCTILGWGISPPYRNPDFYLKYAEDLVTGTWPYHCPMSKQYFVCVKPSPLGSAVCLGDSGSPIVCDGKIWGVNSHFTSATGECYDQDMMFYTELYNDLNWIMGVSGTRRTVSSLEGVFASVCCVWLVALNGGT